jgi:hypothetical protein
MERSGESSFAIQNEAFQLQSPASGSFPIQFR